MSTSGAVALFPGGHGKTQLRPFPFTAGRAHLACQLAGEQHSRAASLGDDATPGTGESADAVATPATDADDDFRHVSVMLDEIVELFSPEEITAVVDATLGAGGHAEAILNAHPGVRVIGLDRDRQAIEVATKRLERFGSRFVAHRIRFDELADVVEPQSVDGVFFDLGVSSPQLDHGDRGFSHRHDGPLDMRMDDRDERTAADIVNEYDEADLAGILRRHADERHARRIASGIVAARPLATTRELSDVVVAAVPAAARRQPRHPAMRTFQAIRIEVNSELDVLEPALLAAVDALRPGGRLAVLSYHSGEDRITKRVMREEARTSPRGRPDLPPPTDAVTRLRLLWSGARRPSDAEIERNPRASSARFRAAQRTEQGI